MCHLVLMMPFLGLAVFWFWPLAMAGPVYAVIVVVSALFYFAIFRALKKSVQTGSEGLVHEMAEVLEPLSPEGHVRVHGEIWKAESSEPLRKGERAEIVGVERLTLKVRHWQDDRQKVQTPAQCFEKGHLPGFRKLDKCEK